MFVKQKKNGDEIEPRTSDIKKNIYGKNIRWYASIGVRQSGHNSSPRDLDCKI